MKVDNKQQNNKCWLCGDINETINHINECSKQAQKEIRLGGKGDLLGIVQEIKIWQYYQIVYIQTRICPWEWDG